MTKKIIALALVLVLAFSLVACKGGYKLPKVGMPVGGIRAGENTNMMVIGDHLYFINGAGSQSGDNTYGTPEVGALVRIRLEHIDRLDDIDDFDKLVEELKDDNSIALEGDRHVFQMIVPKILFSTGPQSTGLFVHEGRFYFITPSLRRNNHNIIEFQRHEIMSCNLDGTDIKTHFTTDPITSSTHFTLYGGKVYFNYMFRSVLYSIDVNARSPKPEQIAEDVASLFVHAGKLFYVQKQYFKDAHDKDTPSPYDFMLMCNPDGSGEKRIGDGRAHKTGGNHFDSADKYFPEGAEGFDQHVRTGRDFNVTQTLNGFIIYTVASKANRPTETWQYNIASDTHKQLSFSILSNIMPYKDGFFQYDQNFIRYMTVGAEGVLNHTRHLFQAGITLNKIEYTYTNGAVTGGKLYYLVGGAIHYVDIEELLKAGDGGEDFLLEGTALAATGLSAAAGRYFEFDNAVFFIGADGFPYRATIDEDDEIKDIRIRYIAPAE
jgi:hypothetical protein